MKATVVLILKRRVFLCVAAVGARKGRRSGSPTPQISLLARLLMCAPVHRDTHPPPQGLQHPQSECHPVPCQFHRCRRRLPSLQVCHRPGDQSPEASGNAHTQNFIKAAPVEWVRLDLGQAVVGRSGFGHPGPEPVPWVPLFRRVESFGLLSPK